MGVSISGLTAGTTLGEEDVFEIEQSGVSKKLTKQQLRSLLFSDPAFAVPAELPQEGDVVSYDGSDFLSGALPRWRVIHPDAYSEATPASSSTITFDGGEINAGIRLKATDYFVVGTPVRVEIGTGVFHYGICTEVTAALLTISGAILPSSPILSLAVGTQDMVKHVDLQYAYTTDYTAVAASGGVSGNAINYGLVHRWRGKTGYLVAFSAAHQSVAATTVINLKLNAGSAVSTAGLSPAAGSATVYGAFTDSALGDLIKANCEIADKQTITVVIATTGGVAYYLKVCMTFILP